MAMPGILTVGLNDDEAERRKRRLKTNIGSIMSPGCHTPKFGQSAQSVRAPNPDSGHSSLTNAQIAEHYANCIKLSSQNKISAKNAFGLHLIDHMLQLLKMRGEMTNFQVASSTLDASAKIYAGRVDSIYNDAFKVLGGLGREGSTAVEEKGADGPNKVEKKQRKNVSSGTAVTVEKNPKVLDVNTYDLEFEVDPMFRNTSAAFDDGGVEALLFTHLSIRDDRCLISFDDSCVEPSTEPPKSISGAELQGMFNQAEVANLLLCPTFSDIFLDGSHSVTSFGSDNQGEMSLQVAGDSKFLSGADYSMLPPLSSQGNNFAFAQDFDEYDNANQDEDVTVLSVCGDNGVADFVCDSRKSEYVNANTNEGPLCLIEAIEPSEYSYFAPAVLASWAGPLHWKINRQNTHVKKDASQIVKKSRRHCQLKIEYETVPDTTLLNRSKASAELGQAAKSKMNSVLSTLPRQTQTTVSTLHQLFCRPKLKIKRQKQLIDSSDVDGPWYNYQNLNDNINYCPHLLELEGLARNHMRFVINRRKESGDDYGPGDLAGVSQPEDTTAHFFSNHMLGQTMVESQPCTDDDLLAGNNLVSLPHQVKQIHIDYARNAKRLDVKKLKTKMWEIITQNEEDMKENMVENANTAITSTKKHIPQSTEFCTLYSNLPLRLSAQMTKSLSIPICFVCLLHLANEKSMQVTGQDDLADALIQT